MTLLAKYDPKRNILGREKSLECTKEYNHPLTNASPAPVVSMTLSYEKRKTYKLLFKNGYSSNLRTKTCINIHQIWNKVDQSKVRSSDANINITNDS